MRILFVSDHDYLPDRVGGRESSIDELANRLAGRGHKVQVLVKAKRRNTKRPSGSIYWPISYTVERVSDVMAVAERHLAAMRFDVAIYSVRDFPARMSSRPFVRRRQVLYVRDANEVDSWTHQTFAATQALFANSAFVAGRILERTGRTAHVALPVIDFTKYRVKTTGNTATFINPVHQKGLDFAFALAERHPNIPFKFSMCWDLDSREITRLQRRAAQLSNLTIVDASIDVREIYSDTRVLLVPSQWEEGFGRVVLEAQCSGIPVMANRRGGLPEAVGDGGWLLPVDADVETWSETLTAFWTDSSFHASASARALGRAEAFERETEANIERIETILGSLKRPEIVSRRPVPKCAAILLPSENSPAVTLQSLAGQTCDHLEIFAFQQPGQDLRSEVDIDGLELNIRPFDPDAGLAKQIFSLLREIECSFVVLARNTDRFDADFVYALQSAHLNSLWTAATAVCDVGVVNEQGDIVVSSTSGFRIQAMAENKSAALEDHRDTFGFSTRTFPWETVRVSPLSTGIMFRRDALMLLEGAPAFETSAGFLKFLKFGAHLIGGTIYSDRILCWSGAREDAYVGAMPRSTPNDLPEELRETAAALMVANGIGQHLKPENIARILYGHFPKKRVLALCEREPALREILVKSFIDGTISRTGGAAR